MPEIIDLEIMGENLTSNLKGQSLQKIEVFSPKILRNAEIADLKDSLESQPLVQVRRKAKFLVFEFANDAKLAIHLMLHGNMCWASADEDNRNIVAELMFEKRGLKLKDWSRWMVVELEDAQKAVQSKLLHGRYGIDPFSDDFTKSNVCAVLAKNSRQGIKSLLMDQKAFAGIGNAYADESLYAAGIHPFSRAGTIAAAEKCGELYQAIKRTLSNALDKVRELAHGEEIAEQDRSFMQVYRKEGQKCSRCDGTIIKTRMAGRDTFVCKNCQKLYS